MIAFQVAWIVVFAYFLHYFNHMKRTDCKCAAEWRFQYPLRIVLVALILLLTVSILMRGRFGTPLLIIEMLLIIAFTWFSYMFSSRVRNSDNALECNCAKTTAFKALDVINIIILVLLALTVLKVIATMFVLHAYSHKLVKQSRPFRQ